MLDHIITVPVQGVLPGIMHVYDLEKLTFLVEIFDRDGNGTWRHCMALINEESDGAMVELHDPETDAFLGCMGIQAFKSELASGIIGLVEYE